MIRDAHPENCVPFDRSKRTTGEQSTPVDAHEQSQDLIAQRAEQLDKLLLPSFFHATLAGSLGSQIEPVIYRAYVDKILAESGAPRDPIERMLVEQLILAHQHVAILTARSAKADTAHDTVAYATATARLQAEIRRTALALKEYRLAAGGKSLTVVPREDDSRAVASGE